MDVFNYFQSQLLDILIAYNFLLFSLSKSLKSSLFFSSFKTIFLMSSYIYFILFYFILNDMRNTALLIQHWNEIESKCQYFFSFSVLSAFCILLCLLGYTGDSQISFF